MANRMYTLGKKAFLDGGINMGSDTIKICLVDSAVYTPNTATDQFLSTVTAGGAVIATATLGSKTTTGAVFDAADATFTAVSGAVSEYLVIYKDTGAAGTSPLIALFDTASGLPVTPNSGDIVIVFNASGIFAL